MEGLRKGGTDRVMEGGRERAREQGRWERVH